MALLRSLLLGPEALWIMVYAVVAWFSAQNDPPTEAGNLALERVWWLVPLIGVPASFALFVLHPEARWGLLLRINAAIVVGLNAAVLRAIGAIDYGDSRNSGLLGVWVLALGLMIVLTPIGDLCVIVYFWRAGKET